MAVGIIFMTAMMGAMLFFGHGTGHKHKNPKTSVSPETAVSSSTAVFAASVPAESAPETEHAH